MRYLRFIALLALLLMEGRATMQAQTEDDFWVEFNSPELAFRHHVTSLIVDDRGKLLTGMSIGGVYSSEDEGVTWQKVANGILDNVCVNALYQHWDGKIYAGTDYPDLYVLENQGMEWTAIPVDTPNDGNIYNILCSEDTTLFIDNGGISKTNDWNNYTWESVYVVESQTVTINDILDLGNGIMLASLSDMMLNGGGILRSVDYGNTWEYVNLNDNFIQKIAKNSRNIVFACSYDWNHSLHKSYDMGLTWEPLPPCWECIPSIVIDTNDVLYVNEYCDTGIPQGIFRSTDEGGSFEPIETGMFDKRVYKLYLSKNGFLFAYGGEQYDNGNWYSKIYRSRKSVYEEFEIEVATCPENGGTAIGSGTYHFGEFAHLSATANENYQFVGWTNQDGDTISNESEYAHMIARGGQITAHFVSIEVVEETEGKNFLLWPNPASQTVYIEGVEVKEMQIYNALGLMVKSVQNSNEVSLEGLVQGGYMVRIRDEEGRIFMEKVMVK